jgi:CheY-like chemotaxis protein
MLQYAGHQVIVYNHPRLCLEALLPGLFETANSESDVFPMPSSSLPIDVLILDLHLPDIAGIDVLRYLQSYPVTQDLPLIFCTAAAGPEIASARRVVPQATLVEKPFTFQQLTSAISASLRVPKI